MDDKIYQKYMLAGKIAAKARDYGKDLIKEGNSFLEVANKVENKIKKNGAEISFPVNISVNEIAAHYSPQINDELKFKKGDVVKLDVGSHIDGYIADTAITVEVGSSNFTDMIKASSDSLDAAIDAMKANASQYDIGSKIEETIKSYGFLPISNLTGHSLEKFQLHSGLSVPNVSTSSKKIKFKEGNVLAIEPFATNGRGHVSAGVGSNIYLCEKTIRSKFVRDNRYNLLYNKLSAEFKTLPFAQRWSEKLISNSNAVLKKLSFLGLIKHYPQLIEKKGSIVTQKEHTLIVTKNGCEVTTLSK